MNSNVKLAAAAVVSAMLLIVGLIVFCGMVGHNNDQNWQVLQSVTGNVTIVDRPGYYWKGFGTVWTYPRTLEAFYSDHPNEGDVDDSIGVTFNDGGNAKIGSYVRASLPTTSEQRRLLHRDFQGNPQNISAAMRAHLVNCVKASGPVMSASENQSSRKAEFNQIVEEQLADGLFKMRRTEIELSDLTEIEDAGTDASGNKITKEKKAKVQATEVVIDAKTGKPIIIQPSPLDHYGIGILQFSITETEYDEATLRQFAAKKESYLNAEKSKAQRQEEVQQRLMIEEKGRRLVAEIQAEENQKKERATIQAQQAAEVAVIEKSRAVTAAQQKVEVADQLRKESETLKLVAAIKAETAELDKKATISAAEAQQKAIELGGGISEEKRVLAEIAAKRDVGVAGALAGINVPQTVVGGTSGEGNLLNMAMLKYMGILKEAK